MQLRYNPKLYPARKLTAQKSSRVPQATRRNCDLGFGAQRGKIHLGMAIIRTDFDIGKGDAGCTRIPNFELDEFRQVTPDLFGNSAGP
jgi:hypothetical protein